MKPLVDPILAYLFDLSIYLAVYIVYFCPGILCHSYLCFLVCLVFAFYIYLICPKVQSIDLYIYICAYVFVKLLTGWLIYLSV